MANTIADLREHLFDTLADLRRTEKPMEVDRAKAICDVAQVVINSAKVEVEYIRAVGGKASPFLLPETISGPVTSQTPTGVKKVTETTGGLRRTVHQLRS